MTMTTKTATTDDDGGDAAIWLIIMCTHRLRSEHINKRDGTFPRAATLNYIKFTLNFLVTSLLGVLIRHVWP